MRFRRLASDKVKLRDSEWNDGYDFHIWVRTRTRAPITLTVWTRFVILNSNPILPYLLANRPSCVFSLFLISLSVFQGKGIKELDTVLDSFSWSRSRRITTCQAIIEFGVDLCYL